MPEQILTDNGKVFTGRFGRGPGPVMFDRICTDNGIRHLLTAPYSPTTTGKIERLHKTMRAEFFTRHDRLFTTVADLQDALDAWVAEYNTARPHQSCGGRPPSERFRLADRSLAAADDSAVAQAPTPAAGAMKRPAGVSRWVNAHGKISLAGFSYAVGATYAGEPVEVVVAGGLVDILHAGVVVATHAQRLREDQADRKPRARVARRARDATAGLTVTRLADGAGVVSFAGTPYACGRRWARSRSTSPSSPGRCSSSRDGKVIRIHPIRHDRSRELGAFANPKGRPRRKNSATGNVALRSCRLGTGTHLSPRYRNLTGPAGRPCILAATPSRVRCSSAWPLTRWSGVGLARPIWCRWRGCGSSSCRSARSAVGRTASSSSLSWPRQRCMAGRRLICLTRSCGGRPTTLAVRIVRGGRLHPHHR